jgi:hypothetical protein
VHPKARITVRDGRIVEHPGALVDAPAKQLRKLRRKGLLGPPQ